MESVEGLHALGDAQLGLGLFQDAVNTYRKASQFEVNIFCITTIENSQVYYYVHCLIYVWLVYLYTLFSQMIIK